MRKTLVEALTDYLESEGSIWVSKKDFSSHCEEKKIPMVGMDALIEKKQISQCHIDNEVYYSLPEYVNWENYAAYHVQRILREYRREKIAVSRIDEILEMARKDTGITLHEQQREAVIAGVNNGFCVITGGPGTGKTCTLTTLVYCLRKIWPRIDVRFTAPTGKAARRITESTHEPAKTVQKELAITPENPEKKFFTGAVLIVDEVSMLDLPTAKQVFESIHNGQKCIFVGDINQLPSVGPGAVLRDLLWANQNAPGTVPFVQLTKTFRQANDSNLFQNILLIRDEGQFRLREAEDFQIMEVDDDPTAQLLALFKQEADTYGIDNVACLLPYRRKGLLCSNRINGLIQAMINPKTEGKPFMKVTKVEDDIEREVTFLIGDPVMQLENRSECANGDVGKVVDIKDGRLYVKYIDCTVRYSEKRAVEELDLAYSMSINKSQGSEYASVVMAITMDHQAMLKRNLVYTGITRAKKRCVLLQDENAMRIAIADEDEYKRTTLLAEKIQFLAKKHKYHIA